MLRSALCAALVTVPLALGLTACSDDGITTRSASASGSGSGSASSTGSEHTGHAVPPGVAHQYALMKEEIAEAGGQTRSGEWRIGYIVEAAEPWYERSGSSQTFRAPAPGETHHIEILPIEAATGRLVPDVPVRVEVLDQHDEVVDAKPLNFYHSEFFHYANNFSVPEPGSYTLRVTLRTPAFEVHGEKGQTPPLSEGARVRFDNVRLEPAR